MFLHIHLPVLNTNFFIHCTSSITQYGSTVIVIVGSPLKTIYKDIHVQFEVNFTFRVESI